MPEIDADSLVKRLLDLSAKAKVERFLAGAKVAAAAKRNAFRTKGTREEIRHATAQAVTTGATTVEDLARLVDEVEENGAQHIFLFDRTPHGKRRATRSKLLDAFPAAPQRPTESLYADLPAARRTLVRDDGGTVVVKE